ncbi:MAG TPA: D-Ala-D-Ala carboxypeptidase family metallohydrolase [Candidatus Paceibacterota bacterium]|nr:D-Ala-D-Ala carboxypeptidase family metallohydrolase [Candidatus Paceibacterota bacterium]
MFAALVAMLIFAGLPKAEAREYDFDRVLRRGSHGRDVRALELRVAGWFSEKKRRLIIDRSFGRRTTRAVKAFQHHYGLTVDGIAGPQTFGKIKKLENSDGSTAHFDWLEFAQKKRKGCSRRANSYAGSFRGGRVGRHRAKMNIKRLMWRLEAIRARAGDHPVLIVSGFRSVPYNRCIDGARLSQHLYGLAVDTRIIGVSARRERNVAKRSQIHGLACYSTQWHNHLDLRIENPKLPKYHHWWWPRRDARGRDLTSEGDRCRGER